MCAVDTETAAESTRISQTGDIAETYLQILYIQMEFCPRTLRHVLDTSHLPDASAWQVSRHL